jgi:hypothetical protein
MADPKNPEAIELLRSIDATLKTLVAMGQQFIAQARQSQPKAIAPTRDLDGKHGDPIVKFMPRDWTGPSYKNRAFSECPPDLLDMIAETLDYFASKAEQSGETTGGGKPVAPYKRADAARARGWAKRIREGKHVQTQPPINGHDDESQGEEWADDSQEWS